MGDRTVAHRWDGTGDRLLGTAIETCKRCGVVRKQYMTESLRVNHTRGTATHRTGSAWAYSLTGKPRTWQATRIPCLVEAATEVRRG